jgi:CII-binding regulator of phage lambda lysogenization HflD
MENNKNINWGWILTAVFGIFGFWVMTDLIQSEREVKEKQKIIDSLSNEILLLEEEVEMREREVDLMMSDFDKVEEINKIERIKSNF